MDELLTKNKKLFVTVGVILGVLALWHLYYVKIAIKATGHGFLLNEYGMLALGLSMLALCTGIFMICTQRRMEVIWILTVALLGISAMRVMPGLSAADEPVHYITSYYWSNKLMMTEADDDAGRVLVRSQDFALEDVNDEIDAYYAGDIDNTEFFGMEPEEYNYYEVRHWDELHPAQPGIKASHIVRTETTPLVYLPQALGISLARLTGGNSMRLVTMGKLFNLFAFCVLLYLAVGLMPFGKEIMMASALLPMTVNLAASMSYDAMLIGCTYLFIAKVMSLAYGESTWIEWKDVAVLGVILAVMSPCKMVYCVMAALLLLIPREKFGSTGRLIAIWAICVVCAAGSVLAVNLTTIGRFASAESHELIWAGGEPGYTAGYVLHHPLETARLVYDTFMWNGGYYHQTLIGAYLGNADMSLDVPYVIVMLLTAGLVILPLKKPDDGWQLCKKDKIVIAAVSIVIFGLLMGSMLIGWTPLSSNVILGVQGRYLLPLLPVMLLLIRCRWISTTKDMSRIVLFLMTACDVFALFRLYSMVCLHI